MPTSFDQFLLNKDVVISAESLKKRYRLGERQAAYDTLRDSVAHWFSGKGAKKNTRADLWALNDVSFEVKKGDVLGIIGKNGAGKTTLLKVLSRITEPTLGWVGIKGRVSSLLEVGTGFHPELTGRDNTYLNGAIIGMSRNEINRKFDDIVAFAELEKFIDTPVKYYSSGMYVRLAFAVAAHLEPEVLIIDEVLAVGDIEFQKRCIGKMEKVAREGRTVLVVSHQIATVKSICTKAMLLENGRVKLIGDVDQVIQGYLSQGEVSSLQKDFNDTDHSSLGGDKIRVRRVRLENGVEGQFQVYWNQPIELVVDIEVFSEVDDVSFGACLRLLDGTFLVVVYNNDDGKASWSFKPGRHGLRIRFENNVKPGVYMLSLGAHQKHVGLKNLFHLDAGHLEILGYDVRGKVAPMSNPALITGVVSELKIES